MCVGVICMKREAVAGFCKALTPEWKLAVMSAAMSRMKKADTQIMVFVFIALLDIIVSCIECVLFAPFMYFSILSMYNAPSYWLAGFSE